MKPGHLMALTERPTGAAGHGRRLRGAWKGTGWSVGSLRSAGLRLSGCTCLSLMYGISIPQGFDVFTDHATELLRPAASQDDFTDTQWSLVLTAGQTSSPGASAALEQLCRTYWYPLFAYVRRSGRSPHDSQDLVQEFFTHFLEQKHMRLADPNRGRFRSFLLVSLKRFLINEWSKANRAKRGNGRPLVSLEDEGAEERFAAESATNQEPDAFYDRQWAAVLLERAMSALRAELGRAGKLELFDRMKVYVWGERNSLPYAAMAGQLGMSEGAVKVAVHRLRRRYGELLRDEIARTVSAPLEVEEELRYLLAVIRSGFATVGT